MDNFTYHNPTKIVFGKGSIAELSNLIPAEARILLTYGGGSIKRNGVYEQVQKALAGRKVLEFGGIQPNPMYETIMKAVTLVKSERIGFLPAVGGGSVLDGTKFVAVAARYEGADPWDIVAKGGAVTSGVPLGTVLTLAATGSETNGFAVISRQSTNEKLAFWSPFIQPAFAVLDPETMTSLPTNQVRNGIVDAWAHVMEQYGTAHAGGALQDRLAEAILLTLREQGPAALKSASDYTARCDYMWSATQALSGLIGCGVPQDWSTHMIGHELTAFFGLAHAESLAIVMPSLLHHQKKSKAAKLEQYARRVFGATDKSQDAAIETGIARTVEFFHSLGMPTRLVDHGISPADAATKVSERFKARGTNLGEKADLTPDRVREILLAC